MSCLPIPFTHSFVFLGPSEIPLVHLLRHLCFCHPTIDWGWTVLNCVCESEIIPCFRPYSILSAIAIRMFVCTPIQCKSLELGFFVSISFHLPQSIPNFFRWGCHEVCQFTGTPRDINGFRLRSIYKRVGTAKSILVFLVWYSDYSVLLLT